MGRNYLGKRPTYSGQPSYSVQSPTTGTKLDFTGDVYHLSSTSALKTWILQAPRANQIGQTIEIACVKATTSLLCRVLTSGCSFYSTVSSTATTKDAVRFNRADQNLTIRAISTSKVRIVASYLTPTITTS